MNIAPLLPVPAHLRSLLASLTANAHAAPAHPIRPRFPLTALTLLALGAIVAEAAPLIPPILPIPQQVELQPGTLRVNPSVVIALSAKPTAHDLFLAQSLTAELAQRYGLTLRAERLASLPREPFVAIGTWQNPLIEEAEKRFALHVTAASPGTEGYVLLIQPGCLIIDGSDEAGAFYGLQSVCQLLAHATSPLVLPGLRIRDWPNQSLRGLKLYLPGRDHIAIFKRFVRDFMALYKYNCLFVEFNGGMSFDRHPEINAGWIDLFKDLKYTRRQRPAGPDGEFQDSPNQDVADGGVLDKSEVADLVSWTRRQHIEIVPEVPSLTHSYYLLTRHRELADPAEAQWEWPDAYDAANPRTHRLLFDVLDEIVDVTKPRLVLIGHDEWRAPLGTVLNTDSASRRKLYVNDVQEIHNYLAAKGIRTAIYGDHLIEGLRGRGSSPQKTPDGHVYAWPGALTPEQVATEIPKDILISNWFWEDGEPGQGEATDIQIENWGFQQLFSNLRPDISNYARRSARRGVLGGAPSSWAATTEFNFSKDLMYDFIGCANLTWSTHWPKQVELSDYVQAEMPYVRRNLSGHSLPSQEGDTVDPLPLTAQQNAGADPHWGLDPATLRTGLVSVGPLRFQLTDPRMHDGRFAVGIGVSGQGPTTLPAVSAPIPIGADVSSLIFLHALIRPAGNQPADQYVYNFDDSADLMGYYEVVYEDEFVTTIPIRYGVNILEWSWARHDHPRTYCYGGDAVEVGSANGCPVTFFALEWPNPRLGKKIKEVRLHGSVDFQSAARTSALEENPTGPPGIIIPSNVILLRAISVVRPRDFPGPDRAQTAPAVR